MHRPPFSVQNEVRSQGGKGQLSSWSRMPARYGIGDDVDGIGVLVSLAMTSCRIECERCGREFDSPLQFEDEESFLTSELVGTMVPCDKCGLLSPCTPENMVFVGEQEAAVDDPDDWKNFTGRDF